MSSVPVTSHPATDAVANSDRLHSADVGDALKSLVDQYGVGLFGQAGRLRGLLQDECPQAKREISVLMQALDEHVPQDLMRVHSGEPIRSLSPRLAKRLVDEKAMSPTASRWAVSTWARGLGIDALDAAELQEPDRQAVWPEPGPVPGPDPTPMPGPGPSPLRDTIVPTPTPRPRFMNAALAIGALVLAAGGWFAFMQPKLAIAGVEAQGPLVGDGKPRAVQLSFEARNTVPQSVEVRFVRGDGNWNTQPSTIDVGSASASERGVLPAGTLSFKTQKPASATFSYVLVAKDGKRSEPFERTFSFVPPLVITDLSVPKAVRVGQNFAVAIKYQRGGAQIVQVERRVVQSSLPWTRTEATQALKIDDDAGQFDYNFDASAQPMNSVVEFTLVDAQGLRSEPRRVALNIVPVAPQLPPGAMAGVVVSVRELRQQGESTGIGAVAAGILGGLAGNQVGRGRGRNLTTALGIGGGVLAGREIERNLRSTSVWEVSVRLSDGSTRVFRQATAPGWQAGDRVVVSSNGTLTAARS